MSLPPLVSSPTIPTSIQLATPFSYGITTSAMVPSTLVEFEPVYTIDPMSQTPPSIVSTTPVSDGQWITSFISTTFISNAAQYIFSGTNYSYSQISGKYVYIQLPWVPDPTEIGGTYGRIRFGPFSFQLLTATLSATVRTFNFYIKNLQGVDTFVLLGSFTENNRRVYFERGISQDPANGIVYYFEYMDYRATLAAQNINQSASFPISFDQMNFYSKTFTQFTADDRFFGSTPITVSSPGNFITCQGSEIYQVQTISFVITDTLPSTPRFRINGPFGIKNYPGGWWPAGLFGFLQPGNLIWNAQTIYGQYEIIDLNGAGNLFYRAKVDNSNKFPPSNTTEWEYVGTTIPYRDYDYGTTTYNVGDYVRYLNVDTNLIQVYVCTTSTNSQPPYGDEIYDGSFYWQVVPTPNNSIPFTITAPSTYTGEPAYYPTLTLSDVTSSDLVPLVSGVGTTALTFSSGTGFQSIPTQSYQLVVDQRISYYPLSITDFRNANPNTQGISTFVVGQIIRTTSGYWRCIQNLPSTASSLYTFGTDTLLRNYGPTGPFNNRYWWPNPPRLQPWSAEIPYIPYETVTYEGNNYITYAASSNQVPSNGPPWATGTTIIYQGPIQPWICGQYYAASIAYTSYGGTVWKVIADHFCQTPSSTNYIYWEPISDPFVHTTYPITVLPVTITTTPTLTSPLSLLTYQPFLYNFSIPESLVNVSLRYNSNTTSASIVPYISTGQYVLTFGSTEGVSFTGSSRIVIEAVLNAIAIATSDTSISTTNPFITITPSISSGSLSLYKYEPFNYVFTTDPSVVGLSFKINRSSSEVQSFLTVSENLQSVTFAGSFAISYTNTLSLIVDLVVGSTIIDSRTILITVGSGRFFPPAPNQNFQLYQYENISNTFGSNIEFFTVAPMTTILSSPSLPSGLTFSGSSNSFFLQGTPNLQVGQSNYQIIGSNSSNGRIVTSTISLRVNAQQVRITPTVSSLVDLRVGTAIDPITTTAIQPATSFQNTFRYTWSSLPDGLTFQNINGSNVTQPFQPLDGSLTITLAGSPSSSFASLMTSSGENSFQTLLTGSQTDNNGRQTIGTSLFNFSLGETVIVTVSNSATLYKDKPLGTTDVLITAGSFFSSATIESVTANSLPPGLSLVQYISPTVYRLTGTPTTVNLSGTYTFTATNTNGNTGSIVASIPVNPDVVTFGGDTPPNGTVFSYVVSKTVTPIVFSVTTSTETSIVYSSSISLETYGLSLNSVTGVLSGTPTASLSSTTITITATNIFGTSATTTIVVTILPDVFTWPTYTPTYFQNKAITPFEFIISSTLSGRPILSYSSTDLPSGLVINPDGLLLGTPTVGSSGSFTIIASTGYTILTQVYSYTLIADQLLIVQENEIDTVSKVFGPNSDNLIIAGGSSGGNIIGSSPDGINWTLATSYPLSGVYTIAWNGSYLVAGGTGGGDKIATSLDGITWTGRGGSVFTDSVWGVAWNGSYWVAVASAGTHTIATSPDGINWSGRGTTVFTTRGWTVAWNGSYWLAGGQGTNTLATSPDGINWTPRSSDFTTRVRSVAWNGSYWVAVGTGLAKIATSPDGITWTSRSVTSTNVLRKVAWNGSLWIALEDSSSPNITSSSDGINWTQLRPTSLQYNNDITWNGSFWVAIGSGIATSPDGINWTSRSNPITFGYTVASTFGLVGSQGVQYTAIQYSSDSYVNPIFSIGTLSPSTSATISVTPNGLISGNFINGTLNTTYLATLTAVYQDITSTRNVLITIRESDVIITGNEYARTITAASGTIITNVSTIYVTTNFGFFTLTETFYNYVTSVPHGLGTEIISVSGYSGDNSWANFTNQTVGSLNSTEFRYRAAFSALPNRTATAPGRINNWNYYTTSIPHNLSINKQVSISGLTTSEFNISSGTVIRVPSTTVFVISSNTTGTAVTSQTGRVLDISPLTFTQPTQTTLVLYQYLPYSIPVQAIGTNDFIYYYTATIPIGFQLVKNNSGTIATFSGNSSIIFNQTTTVYAKTYTGNAYKISILLRTITPFFVNPQSGAGAYTALLRNDVEANAAQNARDNRTFPQVDPLAGPLMAPRAPDVVTPDDCQLKLCKKPCPTCHTMM